MSDMELDLEADMEVDKVADMVADMVEDMVANEKKIGRHGVGHSKTKCIGPKLFDADFALQSVSYLRVFASLLGSKKI